MATAGSAIFFAAAPGVVAGLGPWLITGWRPGPAPLGAPQRVLGVALFTAGAVVLLHAFGKFVVEGAGTPAPVAPTARLVVGGLYRYVRNPMYLAVTAAILGQAVALGRADLLLYAALAGLAMVLFAREYEEPALRRRFGAQYDEHRRHVPGWWPRLRPWHPPESPESPKGSTDPADPADPADPTGQASSTTNGR
jgi:protein-S-isoprenylcysteine O-methyltransferase Ste14